MASDVTQAVEAVAFLLGAKTRRDPVSGTWYIGSDPEKLVVSFPSYGLTATEVRGAIKDGQVIADRVVVEADSVRAAQIGETLGAFSNRLSLTMEILVLDVASNSVDRVNAWLDQVNIGAGYVTKSAIAAVDPAAGLAAVAPDRGWVWDVDLRGLLRLLDDGGNVRMELRQQVQVMSGGKTRFESGEVIEVPLIVREPQTGRDLITQIDRRTVGLDVTLEAVHVDGRWVLTLAFLDSSINNGREVKTSIQAQKMLRPDAPMTLLASFTRATVASKRSSVPILGTIPKIGRRLFSKGTTDRGNRSIMILARPVSVATP